MKLKLTIVFAKTNTNTLWYHETLTPEEDEYFQKNYIDTGKLTMTRTFSPDNLIMTVIYHYPSAEARQEHMEDAILSDLRQQKVQYNNEHGIYRISFELVEDTDE